MAGSYAAIHPVKQLLEAFQVSSPPPEDQFLCLNKTLMPTIDLGPYGGSCKVLVHSRTQFLGDPDIDTRRPIGGGYKMSKGGVAVPVDVETVEHAPAEFIDRKLLKVSQVGDEELSAAKRLRHLLLTSIEKSLAELFFTTGNWANDAWTNFNGATAKVNTDTGRPLSGAKGIVSAFRDQTHGLFGDTAVTSWEFVDAICSNPEARRIFSVAGGGNVRGDHPLEWHVGHGLLAAALKLKPERLFIGNAFRRTSNANQSLTAAPIWGDHLWYGLLGADPNMRMRKKEIALDAVAAANFELTPMTPDAQDKQDPPGRLVTLTYDHVYKVLSGGNDGLGILATDLL